MTERNMSMSDCLTVAMIFDNGVIENVLLPRPTLRNHLNSAYVKELIERRGYMFVDANNWKPLATSAVIKTKADFIAFYDDDSVGVVGEPTDVRLLRHSDYIVFLRTLPSVDWQTSMNERKS